VFGHAQFLAAGHSGREIRARRACCSEASLYPR
jgi:hypothetical protein